MTIIENYSDRSQVPPPPFPFPFRYFAETQPKLQQLNLSIALDASVLQGNAGFSLSGAGVTGSSNYSQCQLQLSVKRDASDESSNGDAEGSGEFPIKLPEECGFPSPIFSKISPAQAIYDFRIPFASTSSSSSSSSPHQSLSHAAIEPFSAKQLQAYQPSSINCSCCSTPLAFLSPSSAPASSSSSSNPDSEIVYKALPSEHYQELIEAYLCHPSGEFAKKFEQINEKGFWPSYEEISEKDSSVVESGVPGGAQEHCNGNVRKGSKGVVLVGDRDIRVDEALALEWMKLNPAELVSDPVSLPFFPICSSTFTRTKKKDIRLPSRELVATLTDTNVPNQPQTSIPLRSNSSSTVTTLFNTRGRFRECGNGR